MPKDLSIKTIINALLPPLTWATLIFYLSNQSTLPSPNLATLDFILKKLGHLTVYAVFYWLVWRALFLLSNQESRITKSIWLTTFIICMLYAISDEWHQSLTPNRTASWRDVGFDFAGMTTAFLWKYKYI